jgi:hypothetical protein
MIMQPTQKLFGKFFNALIINSVLPLTVLSGVVSLNDIEGSWKADVAPAGGTQVQSHLTVNQSGEFADHFTGQVGGRKFSGTLVGTICISNDWISFTITNDFDEHTILPRPGQVYKVIGFDPQRLSLATSNGSYRVDYFRVVNAIKPSQISASIEKAKKIELSTVKFDSLPLAMVINMLQDESVKCDPARKGVKISLGPDAKQLANTEINLEIKDGTLAETLGRVADSVGLEVQATDTEVLLVLKKAK